MFQNVHVACKTLLKSDILNPLSIHAAIKYNLSLPRLLYLSLKKIKENKLNIQNLQLGIFHDLWTTH